MDAKIDLKNILELHRKWREGEDEGVRADLRGAYLGGANLTGANLTGAYLGGADLIGADLRRAGLRDANLRGANLIDANLGGANLTGADLTDADLRGADLTDADLRGATGAELALAMSTHLPEGQFDAWKKCKDGVLVHLRIPASAKRSHGCERKCRASKVKVLEVIGAEFGVSKRDESVTYRKGETVVPKNGWDEDRWNTCAPGIHFFLTRLEAEAYDE